MPRVYTRRPLIDRVFDLVTDVDGHWIWGGSTGSSGYGKIGAGGRRGKMLLVHRVTWEYFRGPIPDGLVLDHLDDCLNILCCNPFTCLEPVTQAVNQQRQTARRNRTACEAGHPYTPESTYWNERGQRSCRICHAERERRYRQRRRIAKQIKYAGICKNGHVRTPENTHRTGRDGLGLGCSECPHGPGHSNESPFLLIGSVAPPSNTAVKSA